MKKNNIIILLLLLSNSIFSQPVPKGYVRAGQPAAWTTKPFGQKVFIENKGQFDKKTDNPSAKILFGTSIEGVELYFSTKGLIYKYDELIHPTPPSGQPKDESAAQEEEMEEKRVQTTPHYLSVEWLGANTDVEVITEEQVSFYYTYGGKEKNVNTTIKANAFEKIVYKNIYPNIDVEYIFHKDSSGIKYSLILHPGANPADIKMKYEGADAVYFDSGKNVVIKSSFGEFIDHAPKSFYKNGITIKSSFELSGNIVSFKLNKLQTLNLKLETIIIDPWTINPTFAGKNAAYDVEYDLQGNIYVYGGTMPYQEMKFDNTGALQWVYAATPIAVNSHYGSFAVQASSGSSYIGEGLNSPAGCRVIKLDAAGNQIGIFPGNSQLREIWRLVYNNCTKKLIIAGGGAANAQAGILDTSVSAMTPVNVLSTANQYQDMALLAIDNSNNCFMASVQSNGSPGSFNNVMLKCPASTLFPPAYMVPDNYAFIELSSIPYVDNFAGNVNGFNGMAVNNKYLYTYDGRLIQRWNKNTGVLINSAIISPSPFRWGGLAVDECDNIYAGVQASVIRYDTNFTALAVMPMASNTDTVYDVTLGPGNLLYACGLGFVSALPSGVTCTTTTTTLNVTASSSGACSLPGSATATVTGGNAPYTYLWNPTGQTTQTATGLSAGTHTVIVSDNSCVPTNQTATVLITTSGSLSTTSVQSNILCNGDNNGTATVTITNGGTPGYTYNWSPAGGTNSTATGLSASSYTILVTDATGCSGTQTITITEPTSITATITSNPAICNNNNGNATATPNGGTGAFTYSWSPSGGNNATATGLAAGNYTITVTDANSCSKTQTVTVTSVANTLSITASSTPTGCNSATGTATAIPGGGTGTLTYSWSPSGGTNANATGLAAGNYSVMVTDANGCTQTQTVTVTSSNAPTVTLASQINILCNGQCTGSAAVAVAGGSSPYTYLWNPAVATTTAVTGLCAGNHVVTVTDDAGCISTQTATITQPALALSISPSATQTGCNASTGSAAAAVAGGSAPYTYLWNPAVAATATATATGLYAGSYTVTVTDANGCSSDTSVDVTEIVCPCPANLNFILPNAFSPNNDGENDEFCLQKEIKHCIDELKIIIYNRWGENVFESDDKDFCWDGFYKDKLQNSAVFVFYLEAMLTSGKEIKKKGNVSILR